VGIKTGDGKFRGLEKAEELVNEKNSVEEQERLQEEN